MNYSEDPKTLNLYPEVAFEEDLTPDDIGEDIVEKCNAIQKACKGWGTDEDALIQELGLTTAEERMKIPVKFKEVSDGDDLKTLMRKECGKGDFGLALQYLS